MSRSRHAIFGDKLLFALVVGLSGFGAAMIYSAGVVDVPGSIVAGLWRTQLVWLGIALFLFPVVLRVRIAYIEWAAPYLYGLTLVLLVVALVFGTGVGTAAGTKGWLHVGGLRVQPAEAAKVTVILMLARVLGSWREAPRTLWALWKPIAVVAVPMMLVMLQPDLGTAIVFASILLFALFWAGTPLPTLFFLLSPVIGLFISITWWLWGIYIVLVALAVAFLYRPYLSEGVAIMLANVMAGAIALPLWNHLETYQKNRLLVFLDPTVDPRGAGYNLIQSQVAIGSGGLWGKGFTLGTQKRLAFLPEQHTDFIFAVIGEEMGFLRGVLPVLLAFGLIFWRLVRIAERSPDPFASMVPFALFGSWFAHVLINTGMTVGVMPITGIPLPFISYGGSFLLVNLLAMAMVQRIAAESRG